MRLFFVLSLFGTFFLVRFFAYRLHDIENYGTAKDNSRTFTGFLRKKTGLDWHHYHLGIILLLITLPLIFVFGLSVLLVIFLAMGISLTIDQLAPLVDRRMSYFHWGSLMISFVAHLIVAFLFVLIG